MKKYSHLCELSTSGRIGRAGFFDPFSGAVYLNFMNRNRLGPGFVVYSFLMGQDVRVY